MGRAGSDLEIKDHPSSSQGDLLREPWQGKQSWGDKGVGGGHLHLPAGHGKQKWPPRPASCPDGEGTNCHLGGDAAAQPGPP